MPKVILPDNVLGTREPLGFTDARWANITSSIPEPLSAEADARLRNAVMACCSWLQTQQARLGEGEATAAAMRSPGKGQPAPLERVAKGLRMAAKACAARGTVKRQLASSERIAKGLRMAADGWAQIGKIFDDRLSDIGRYGALATMAQAAERRAINGKRPPAKLTDCLETMARDAERRLDGIRALGAPVTTPDPWPLFVRNIKRFCREVGLKPTVTNRIYPSAWGTEPTWFQKFIVALDKNLLGSRNLVWTDHSNQQHERDHKASYAAVVAATSGNIKPRKSRK